MNYNQCVKAIHTTFGDKKAFRLTGFYAQFRAIGVNYNQCVKAIHTTFGDKKALAYLYRLTLETQRLEQLVKAVVELTKELLQWCRK